MPNHLWKAQNLSQSELRAVGTHVNPSLAVAEQKFGIIGAWLLSPGNGYRRWKCRTRAQRLAFNDGIDELMTPGFLEQEDRRSVRRNQLEGIKPKTTTVRLAGAEWRSRRTDRE
jgi:hypothetical protein